MAEFNKLAHALVLFQGVVPVIPKNRTAKIPTKTGGSYSYQYADLSDIWDAIRSPLRDNGLAVTQQLCSPHGSNEVGITTTIWHESGQHDSSTFYVSTAQKNPQEVGSLLTYYKRYALAAALGISTDQDDDGVAATHAARPAPKPSAADVKRQQLKDLALSRGWELSRVAEVYASSVQGGDLRSAPADEIEAFMTSLEAGVIVIE